LHRSYLKEASQVSSARNDANGTETHPKAGGEGGLAHIAPFSGSGTTIIAAEQLGRRCYAIEIEPRYVDVAIRRWQTLTGKAATLDGKTWADVAADRGVAIV